MIQTQYSRKRREILEYSTGIGRNTDFIKLWAAQSVSKFGSHITGTALAAIAVLTLKATSAQMGVLSALQGAALLLIGLFAGVWVDRLHRRPVMVITDLGRALILASIPISLYLHLLRMEQLYIVAVLTGILTVFFDVADRAHLPSLVASGELLEANSKLGASDSVAEIGGPALAGTLVQWLTAPVAVFFDCLTFVFSALCVKAIRKPEPQPAPRVQRSGLFQEIGEGLHFIFRDPYLRAIAGSAASKEFFGNFYAALYWLFLVRELGLTPGIVGLTISMGGVGALLGAFLSERTAARFGIGRTLTGTLLFMCGTGLLIPLAHGPKGLIIGMIMAAQFFGDTAYAIYMITETSARQALIPSRLMGRATASLDFLTRGVGPIGALVGGFLGGWIGMRPTLMLTLCGSLLALLWVALSPLRRMRELPLAAP